MLHIVFYSMCPGKFYNNQVNIIYVFINNINIISFFVLNKSKVIDFVTFRFNYIEKGQLHYQVQLVM